MVLIMTGTMRSCRSHPSRPAACVLSVPSPILSVKRTRRRRHVLSGSPMERNLIQVDYEHNYNWYSISGYRLSDRLVLTASVAFATSDPPSGICVVMADQQKIPAVLKWSDPHNGAALLSIEGPSPSSPVTAFQWGELGTTHGKLGCEVRYLEPGIPGIQRFPAFLDPRRRDEEPNYLLDVNRRPRT